jgi:hypothetical protein
MKAGSGGRQATRQSGKIKLRAANIETAFLRYFLPSDSVDTHSWNTITGKRKIGILKASLLCGE